MQLSVFLPVLHVDNRETFFDNLDTAKPSRRRFWWIGRHAGCGLKGELGFMTKRFVVELGPSPSPKIEIGY